MILLCFHHYCFVDMKKCSTSTLEKFRPIRVRFTKGPSAAALAYRADEKGFAHIQVSNYNFEFFTSTVDKLGPLFKDESISEPMPMLIEVTNFDLCLQVGITLHDCSILVG